MSPEYNPTVRYQYNGAGKKTEMIVQDTSPFSTSTIYSYDPNGRLTGSVTTKDSITIDSVSYTLNDIGHWINKADSMGSHDYFYDATNRLTQVTTGSTQQEQFMMLSETASVDPMIHRQMPTKLTFMMVETA